MKLTPGVRLSSDALVCEALGCVLRTDGPNFLDVALANGLVTESPRISPTWLNELLFPRSRAELLPGSRVGAAIYSLSHNALGMVRWWVAVVGLCLAGRMAPLPSLLALGGFLGIFLISVLVHELGDVVCDRFLATPGAYGILVSSGIKCYLVRPSLGHGLDRWVSAAGPMAPMVVGVVALPLLSVFPFFFWGWAGVAVGRSSP